MTTGWARAKIAGSLAALLGSFAMSAVTWIGIGGIAGYGPMRYLMPLVVDAYIICAIATGMSTDKPDITRAAYYHALSAAVIGTIAQAIFHCAGTWAGTTLWFGHEYQHVTWAAALAFVAGGLPPSFAFLGVHLLGKGSRITDAPETDSHTTTLATQLPSTTQPQSPPQTTTPTTTPAITPPTKLGTTPIPPTPPPVRPLAPPAQPKPLTPTPVTNPPRQPNETRPAAANQPRRDRERIQQTIRDMLITGTATYDQIAAATGVHRNTVLNHSRRMRQERAARNGHGARR